MTDRPPLLLLDDVGVVYPGGVVGMHPARLAFHAGQFVVLLGPSGAGKSSLLRTINHMVPPSQGRVTLQGVGALADRRSLRAARRRIGFIFQQHQLIGRVSALGNVLTGRLGYHSTLRSLWPLPDEEKRGALAALERVGLLDVASKRVDQLSGGQQQRVGIARALAQAPAVLLADEPVASLDPATAERVLALIHGICKADGIAAIVSLHQVELARRFADRVVGIAAGRVVHDGDARSLDRAVLERIYGTLPAGEAVAAARPSAAGGRHAVDPLEPAAAGAPA